MDYEVTRMFDRISFDPSGGQNPVVDVTFMVGKLGPFNVTVPKTGEWQTAMRTAITAEVQRVKSITL